MRHKRRDRPQWFALRWRNELTGYEFTARYQYTGWGPQEGYSFPGWRLRCISQGKSEGFAYLGRGGLDDEDSY